MVMKEKDKVESEEKKENQENKKEELNVDEKINSLVNILGSMQERIQNIEAALFRLKGSI